MKKFLLFLLLLVYAGMFFMCNNKNGNKKSANTHEVLYLRNINRSPWFLWTGKGTSKDNRFRGSYLL